MKHSTHFIKTRREKSCKLKVKKGVVERLKSVCRSEKKGALCFLQNQPFSLWSEELLIC